MDQGDIYLLGKSAIDESINPAIIQRNVELLNDRMLSSSALGKRISFGTGRSISTQSVIDKTIGAVFGPEQSARYGLQLPDTVRGRNITLTKLDKAKLRGLLSDEGINISDRRLDKVTNLSLINPKILMRESASKLAPTKTAFHELGHSASSLLRFRKFYGYSS